MWPGSATKERDVSTMKTNGIPKGYRPVLDVRETQQAIGKIKTLFENELRSALTLYRVSAPLFLDPATGLNDDLNGVERPVSFAIKGAGTTAQVVHSLAKWKRKALYDYGFQAGTGLLADMNAIRRDEELDALHSVYVDQWDWEKVITSKQRNTAFLEATVRRIVGAICNTYNAIRAEYPQLPGRLSREVHFVTTQQLEDLYPALAPKKREDAFVKEHPTTFLLQIGDTLRSGARHDGRAPDYDDWALNGDLLFWCEPRQCALEVSSMGIRVDAESMGRQLAKAGCDHRRSLPFHQMVLSGKLPLTMGGGIGQSRLCMLLLGKAHIGEVQCSLWDSATISACQAAGVPLL